MKTTTRILWLSLAMLIALPLRAEDAAKKETPAKVDYKDAFLGLALEKTKLYSGKIEDALGKGIEVAQKEAPELAKEYLTWRFWYHAIAAGEPVVGFLVTLTTGVLLVRAANKRDKAKRAARYEDRNDMPDPENFSIPGVILLCVSCMILVVVFVNGTDHIRSAIQIKVAPRIYLIERMAEIVKQ